ncbi:MAG: hypothetical protein ACTTH6_01975 [Candidatus Altimarinota bacterium]
MTKIHTFPDEEKIIRQIQEEYKEGLDHVRQKRAIKQEEIKDYVESSKDKVRKHIIYTFMQAYMSVLYTGTHTARWSGEGGRIQEKAENLNQVAEFDGKNISLCWQIISTLFFIPLRSVVQVRPLTPEKIKKHLRGVFIFI